MSMKVNNTEKNVENKSDYSDISLNTDQKVFGQVRHKADSKDQNAKQIEISKEIKRKLSDKIEKKFTKKEIKQKIDNFEKERKLKELNINENTNHKSHSITTPSFKTSLTPKNMNENLLENSNIKVDNLESKGTLEKEVCEVEPNEIKAQDVDYDPLSFRQNVDEKQTEQPGQPSFNINKEINYSEALLKFKEKDLESITNVKDTLPQDNDKIKPANEKDREIANFETDNIDEGNIFWNLRNAINDNFEEAPPSFSRSRSFVNKKIPTNEQMFYGTLSNIDKGKSVFVSTDDMIFSLPVNFIPKNSLIGNSFKITIEEISKGTKSIERLQDIQKKFLYEICQNEEEIISDK